MARRHRRAQNAAMTNRWRGILVVLFAALTACGYTRLPEERTDDGLVRVPSRASGGVYRDIAADFTPYRRFILEPPTVEFIADWRKQHQEVDDRDIASIRDQVVKLFRDEFTREMARRRTFEYAEAPAADVLRVIPRVVDLDILAPDTGKGVIKETYTTGPVKMQITGELRDAASNALLARIIIYEGQFRYGQGELDVRLANRATNAREMRIGFNKWATMVHEALNVAKVAKPR